MHTLPPSPSEGKKKNSPSAESALLGGQKISGDADGDGTVSSAKADPHQHQL
jgi:hypothetical protein